MPGGEREPHPEAAVSSRKMVTFVTCSSSRTEFLVSKMFYNDFLFELVLVRLGMIEGEVNLSRVFPARANDLEVSFLCFVCYMMCLWR